MNGPCVAPAVALTVVLIFQMGVVQMALRRPADAISFLARAHQKSPAGPSVTFQLGLAHSGLQQCDQAAALLEDVFRLQPVLDGLGYYVRFMRYRRKNYRAALHAFRSSRATDPDIQRFYAGLAIAALGLPGQAAAEVEQALRLAPGSALTGPAERLWDTIVAARSKERRLSAEPRRVKSNVSVFDSTRNVVSVILSLTY